MSVAKVPWGQRRELGLNWEPQPRDPIGLLSRRDGNRNFHHGHWLIMFLWISTRIYDFLALRTTAIIICHDSFFNDLRGQQKKIVLPKYATISGMIAVYSYALLFRELGAYKLFHKVFIINFGIITFDLRNLFLNYLNEFRKLIKIPFKS